MSEGLTAMPRITDTEMMPLQQVEVCPNVPNLPTEGFFSTKIILVIIFSILLIIILTAWFFYDKKRRTKKNEDNENNGNNENKKPNTQTEPNVKPNTPMTHDEIIKTVSIDDLTQMLSTSSTGKSNARANKIQPSPLQHEVKLEQIDDDDDDDDEFDETSSENDTNIDEFREEINTSMQVDHDIEELTENDNNEEEFTENDNNEEDKILYCEMILANGKRCKNKSKNGHYCARHIK